LNFSMDSIISSFHESLINSFSNIYLVILLNLFFIFATYTDLKYMKIYDKFNIVMLITRILILIYYGITTDWIMGGAVVFLTFLLSAMYTQDSIAGDIKFGGNIGLWLGFYPSIILVLLTIIFNLIYRGIFRIKKKIPLAPYFYMAYIVLGVYYFIFLT